MKNENAKFSLVELVFMVLKHRFFIKDIQNRPRFSGTVHRTELKFFLQILDTICRNYFFFILENLALLVCIWLYNESTSWQKCRFLGCSWYFSFFIRKVRVKRKSKKVVLANSIYSLLKKSSVQFNVLPRRNGGDSIPLFWTFWREYLLNAASDKFASMTNFAHRNEIYHCWKFQKFPMCRSRKVPERGGGTLNADIHLFRFFI